MPHISTSTLTPASREVTDDNRGELLGVIQQSLSIRRHIELFLWLNGEIQLYLPHDILIVAWGDFKEGKLLFDVISAIPGVRTNRLSSQQMIPFAAKLFEGWLSRGCAPYTLQSSEGFVLGDQLLGCPPIRAIRNMRSALVHGLKDVRGSIDCLYVTLSAEPAINVGQMRNAIELLLPHLDLALRRLHHVEADAVTLSPAAKSYKGGPTSVQVSAINDLGLSGRELEIMAWVREGKTNFEIGQILDISVFTVKNHLQRVYKKLDVYNRAQAVARIGPNGMAQRV